MKKLSISVVLVTLMMVACEKNDCSILDLTTVSSKYIESASDDASKKTTASCKAMQRRSKLTSPY
jgi:hypothetical protein